MVKLKRSGPIMGPSSGTHGSFSRFNPGVYWDGEEMHVLYRASNSAISDKQNYVTTIGYARAGLDGRVSHDTDGPVIRPETPEERMGCEDARIVQLDGRLLVFYTAFSGDTTRVAVSETSDFTSFTRLGLIDNGFRDKDAFIFPELIGGKLAYVHRVEPGIQIELVDELETLFSPVFWNDYAAVVDSRTIMRPEQQWEARKIGGGAPPLKTDSGWLLIYHGVSQERRYCAGAALLDPEEPRRVVARLPYPVLEPEEEYERIGDVPNVVFPEGAFIHQGTLHVVYGAADTHIAVGSVPVADLLEELMLYAK